MHQKFGKDRAYNYGDIVADRQTDTQTDRHTYVLIAIQQYLTITQGYTGSGLDVLNST